MVYTVATRPVLRGEWNEMGTFESARLAREAIIKAHNDHAQEGILGELAWSSQSRIYALGVHFRAHDHSPVVNEYHIRKLRP